MNISQRIVKDIVTFCLKTTDYYKSVEREELERCTALHIQYGTMLVLHDDKGISVVARWNVLPSRDTLHIIDIIIRPDLRSIKMLRYVSLKIWQLYPTTTAFYYERVRREKSYGFNLKHWLKIKEKSHERKI